MNPPIEIYTDGACSGNPGPGGYGVVLISGAHTRELAGGFRKTTNNRMELLACIEGLRALKKACAVVVTSDSKYVVNAISKGWAKRWRSNDWKLSPSKWAKNPDLWEILLDLCTLHDVRFEWVKGHSEHPQNDRCDALAVAAAQQQELPPDLGFENPPLPHPEGDLFGS